MRIYLQRPESDNDPARFYQLILQPDLLGGATLIRQWGRLGERGSHRKTLFHSLEEAQQELENLRKRLQEQGYTTTFIQGIS